MKWIQGKWKPEGSNKASDYVVLVNPEYITTIDLERKLLWAEDCDVAVEWEDDELELINKLTGRPAEEELKKNSGAKKNNV